MEEQNRFDSSAPIDVEYTVTAGETEKKTLGNIQTPETKAPNPRLNIILFIATLFTTTFAGALMEVGASGSIWSQLHKGFPFSLTLLTILLFHEFGHYFMARKHHVEASLPYFIPAPSLIGTFGAVIKMRSPMYSKRSLLDIGAAGPLAGVIVAIPATIIGLLLSEVRSVSGIQGGISLGSSLLFSFLARIFIGVIPENYDIFLHPMAFAGWIGLLVTMLNLIPIGQLDGGHIAYAVLGERWHRLAARIILPLLLLLGIIAWKGWLVWCVLLFFVMGTKHPPTIDDHIPLDNNRKVIGWISLVLFVLTFTPNPFQFAW